MSHHHFTTFERGRIQELKNSRYTNREIAKKLNRHHSSIDREIKRNSKNEVYECETAQYLHEKRRKYSKPQGKKTESLILEITEKLTVTWSPEQIANTVTKNRVSFKTIYNWIYRGYLPSITTKNLRQKGKRRKGEKRGKFSMGTPISERPKELKTRVSFGHWELDSVVSSRGEIKGCFAPFVDRKSRLYTAIKTPDRTASSMKSAITQLFNALPKGAFLSGTTDRGKEFACCETIKEQLGITLYFADAYCSWQRGSNENSNGLLREFYPKKSDLSLVSQDDLIRNLFLINSRPRKCLGWKSPIQIFYSKWRF